MGEKLMWANINKFDDLNHSCCTIRAAYFRGDKISKIEEFRL